MRRGGETSAGLAAAKRACANLPDGDSLMNYNFVRDESGALQPEDIDSATHFERVVYDRNGNIIGSTVGELNQRIRW